MTRDVAALAARVRQRAPLVDLLAHAVDQLPDAPRLAALADAPESQAALGRALDAWLRLARLDQTTEEVMPAA